MVKLRSTTRLEGLSPRDLALVMSHPEQWRIYEAIVALITQLRTCTEPGHFYALQKQLFGYLYPISERRSQCARNAKRIAQGKAHTAEPLASGRDSGSQYEWELETYVFARLTRQLQSVGDALAWTAFRYDRRMILALSANASPGPPNGKEGLDYELGRLEKLWTEEKHFSLLHDLTNCLRIGDLTEFTADHGALLHEVKRTPHVDPAQRRRAQVAIDAVMNAGKLHSTKGLDARFVLLQEQYKTALPQLADLLVLAKERGTQGMKLSEGRALVAASFLAPDAEVLANPEEQLVRWRKARAAAIKRARIGGARNLLTALSTDTAARSPIMAPYGIYPLLPTHCAMVICDFVVFESMMAVESLIAAAEREKLGVVNLLPNRNSSITSSTDILQLRFNGRGMIMHGTSLNVLQYELLSPRTWARGMRELLEVPDPPGEPTLVFSREAKEWA